MSMFFRLVLPLVLALVVVGCPREPEPPGPPPDASVCDDVADCNEEPCGLLRACVDGFCAAEATIAVPCREAATP